MSIDHEATTLHTRLQKCTLELEHSRSYWQQSALTPTLSAAAAFERGSFGARSLGRIEELLRDLKARYAAYPQALQVLQRWPRMPPEVRLCVCHWHLQLADPLYRAFTGEFLPERRAGLRAEVSRDRVVQWLGERTGERWAMSTRIQFASKLLSAAHDAGLIGSIRDPRPLPLPRVPDLALAYLMYLLRGVRFAGTLLDNPYLRSVGLAGEFLEQRLQRLPGLGFRRQGELLDFGWTEPDLAHWAATHLLADAGELPRRAA